MSRQLTVKLLLLLLFPVLAAIPSHAQLATYTFDNEEITPSSNALLIEGSSLQLSTGTLSTGTLTSSGFENPPYAQSSGGWAQQEREDAKYYYLTLTVPDGFEFDITSFHYDAYSTGSGPSATAATIGTTELGSFNLANSILKEIRYDDLDSFTGLTSVEIKIQGWAGGIRTTTGTGSFRIDDLIISGVVRSISDDEMAPLVGSPVVSGVSTSGFNSDIQVLFDGNASLTRVGIIVAESTAGGEFELGGVGVTDIELGGAVQSGTVEVAGLQGGTRYLARAYAQNGSGTGYSAAVSVSTKKGFDGSGYYGTFAGFSSEVPLGVEWEVSDVEIWGDFGVGASGGLRVSDGILGYQLTVSGAMSSFEAELSLVNTSGATIEELMVAYHGWVSRTGVERSPGWGVSVNGEVKPTLAYSTSSGNDSPGIQMLVEDLSIEDGEEFTIKWQTESADGSGGNRQIGISDVVVALPSQTNLLLTGDAGWRMWSLPVWFGSSDYVNTISPIQGYNSDGNEKNFFTGYDGEKWMPDHTDNAFTLSERVGSGNGFIIYVYDNDQFGSEPISTGRTISMQGIDPFFDVTVPIHDTGNRWNLLGNPFSTSFDVRELQADGEFVPVVQFWQDSPGVADSGEEVAGSWVLSNSSLVNNIIAAGQGFMLQNAEDNSATKITFPVGGKTTGGMLYKEDPQADPRIEFWLSEQKGDKSGVIDRAAQIVFIHDEDANIELHQVDKLPSLNGSAQMSFDHQSDENRSLAQFASPFIFGSELQIPIQIKQGADDGGYTISWSETTGIPDHWQIELLDSTTEEIINLRTNSSYEFIKQEPEDANRFKLRLKDDTYTSIEETDLPKHTQLYQNYPNPFNPVTTIRFDLAKEQDVRLEVFDILGRSLGVMTESRLPSGRHSLSVDARLWSSGVYMYRLQTSEMVLTRKMTLIK
ncbi:MAG: T9SS type A sorting domain-containing protein [Balneolales bacterium]|nr:T9SS type A sorting domain-containing protein [Balneolales bacterium]